MCCSYIYAKNKAGIKKRCSLQIRNTNSATIPTPIAPNVWILTSAPTVVPTGITIICPGWGIKIHQKAGIHPHSSPTTSIQCHISTLPSTTLVWNSSASYQHISQHSEPQHDEYLISRIQNMATLRGPLEQDTATSLGWCTINSFWSTL